MPLAELAEHLAELALRLAALALERLDLALDLAELLASSARPGRAARPRACPSRRQRARSSIRRWARQLARRATRPVFAQHVRGDPLHLVAQLGAARLEQLDAGWRGSPARQRAARARCAGARAAGAARAGARRGRAPTDQHHDRHWTDQLPTRIGRYRVGSARRAAKPPSAGPSDDERRQHERFAAERPSARAAPRAPGQALARRRSSPPRWRCSTARAPQALTMRRARRRARRRGDVALPPRRGPRRRCSTASPTSWRARSSARPVDEDWADALRGLAGELRGDRAPPPGGLRAGRACASLSTPERARAGRGPRSRRCAAAASRRRARSSPTACVTTYTRGYALSEIDGFAIEVGADPARCRRSARSAAGSRASRPRRASAPASRRSSAGLRAEREALAEKEAAQ